MCKIESPISAFNNVMLKISKDIQNIYCKDTEKIDEDFMCKLIFTEKSIIIFNKIELCLKNFETAFKFKGTFSNDELSLINITLENKSKLNDILLYYIFTIRKISDNFDYTIQEKFVKNILNNITEHKDTLFLLPHMAKIGKFYDKTLENVINRFSYVVKVYFEDNIYTYKLCRVESNELSQAKSVENIRFEAIETIKEGKIKPDNLEEFLYYLFYYGEINF